MTTYTSAYTGPQIDAALGKANTAVQPGDLGTAASANTEDFASAAQGTKADTAVQPAAIAEFVSSSDVTDIVSLTQAEYDALSPPDAATLYVIL